MSHLQDWLKGCWTSLPTPFKGESIDEGAFIRLIEWQIEEGARCLVMAGEVGEGFTLSDVERETLIWIATNVSPGRVPVVAPVLANGTDKAVAMAEVAGRLGVDAALVTVPYYNKPGQPGILAHFEAIAQATDLPLIVHNAPDRTVVGATIDTLSTLAGYRNIIGVVDHDPTAERLVRLRSAAPRGFLILSGNDRSGPLHRMMGGDGWLSPAASILPKPMRELDCACTQQRWPDMQRHLAILHPLFAALDLEPHPATVKHALAPLGISGQVRLPLVAASPAAGRAIDTAFEPFTVSGLHRDLGAYLHHASRGDLEEVGGIGRRLRQADEDAILPQRHA